MALSLLAFAVVMIGAGVLIIAVAVRQDRKNIKMLFLAAERTTVEQLLEPEYTPEPARASFVR